MLKLDNKKKLQNEASLKETLFKMISNHTKINKEEITQYSFLIDDLKMDELEIIDLTMEIEEVFDIEIPNELLKKFDSVNDVLEAVINITKNAKDPCKFPNIPTSFVDYIVDTYGTKNQDVILIEELSELQKEITKSMRGNENKEHIAEEMAHCLISLRMCMKTHDISIDMIQNEINKKIKKYQFRIGE